MPINLYNNKLKDFEKKNHRELRGMYLELMYSWVHQEMIYNTKFEIDYENFVKYCYQLQTFR
jgi:hypothetical protein